MGPPGPREELAAELAAIGCEVRGDPLSGGAFQVDCPDALTRAQVVSIAAWADARYDARVRALALDLLPAGELSPESVAAAFQREVAARVRYIGEAGDFVQNPIVTWEYAAGDCDCHTRLMLALLRSVGISCSPLAFVTQTEDEINVPHILAVLERRGERPTYLETTLGPAIELGEHPYQAARRLGATHRSDILSMGSPIPPAGCEVPHGTDWWVSTDDALDYANWLDGEIEKIEYEVTYRWPSDQATLPAFLRWVGEFNPIWGMWRQEWKAYLEELRSSWFARVNSWYTIRDKWHAELVRRAKRATELKLPHRAVCGQPKEPIDQAKEDVIAAAEFGWSTFTKIAFVGAIVAGGYLVYTNRAVIRKLLETPTSSPAPPPPRRTLRRRPRRRPARRSSRR